MGIADGILIAASAFDNMIYAYGKGPSATTVAAGPEVTTLGSSVMIKGTVTDQTNTGRHNTNDIIEGTNDQVVDFTLKGTPAISDESMSAWMEYKYMQQIYPADAKGVPVTLDTIDPNGNFYNIDTVTSDINGNYAIPFTPEVPGTYQIIATFAGSNAYGPSHGTTYIAVGNEAAPTSTPTQLPASIADMYFVPATAGIIAAIAIVGVILALLLLKKRA